MKRIALSLAVLAMVVVVGTQAQAAGVNRGSNVHCVPNRNNEINVYYPGSVVNNFHVDSFTEASYRIRAEHSPNRYYTHPLSLLNGPPVPPVTYYNNIYLNINHCY
jgi:hypothetical protein